MLHFSLKNIQAKLTNEDENKRIIMVSTYTILALVSFVMTVLNIVTKKGLLTTSTAVFCLLCLLNLGLTYSGPRRRRLAAVLFAVEIIVLFTFFLVSGNPEGFSSIWIVMLPSLGMMFFGRKRGSLVCGIMLLILIFFLWSPTGVQFLMYPYTGSFRMRFPILYTAFYLLALFLDSIQDLTFREVDRLQNLYREQSMRDNLTGLLNRQGLYATLFHINVYHSTRPINILMLDIDFFKRVNDTYGHTMGDEVLRELANLLQCNLKDTIACRWGGEEFVVIDPSCDISPKTLERFRKLVEGHPFLCDGVTAHITISIGVAESPCAGVQDLDALINSADTALYAAKEAGRNCVVYAASIIPYTEEPEPTE